MSSENISSLLRLLHQFHTQLRDLRGRLAQGPRVAGAQEQRVKQLKTQTETLSAEHQRLALVAKELERQMTAAEQSIVKRRQQLTEAKNNKEYQALQSQIGLDVKANETLAETTLQAMEAAEDFLPRVKSAEEELRQGVAKHDAFVEQFQAEKPTIQTEIERITALIREQEKPLPRPFREVYDRVAKALGDTEVFSEVVNQSFCSECNNQVPINQLAKMMAQQPISCLSCARLLYLPEGYVFDRG